MQRASNANKALNPSRPCPFVARWIQARSVMSYWDLPPWPPLFAPLIVGYACAYEEGEEHLSLRRGAGGGGIHRLF